MKRQKPKYKQIIDAAVIAIAQNGYHQTQVSKIAKEAGVADGTIYLYFKNKEDILVSVFKEKMAVFIRNLQMILKEEKNASKRLLKMIENHFQVLHEDQHLAIITQLELRQTSLQLRLKINEVLKEYLSLLDEILQEGVECGELAKTLNIRLARQMIFGTIDEITTSWVMKQQKYNLIKLSPEVHRLLMKALKAE